MSRFFSINRSILSASLVILASLLTGCSDSKSKIGESEEVLSYKAKKQLSDKKYQAAIEPLTHLSNNYQVSSNAQTYKLELMHAQYQAREYMDAIETANQYITLYPYEPHVDYAMYIKTLSSLREFDSRHWMPGSIRERYGYTDTEIIESGLTSADMLIAAYPKSHYYSKTVDLKNRMREIMLKKSFHIAREYRNSYAYAASQRRLTDVVTHTESKKLLHKSLIMMRDNYVSMQQLQDAEAIDKLINANWKSA